MRRKLAITFFCTGTALLLASCDAKDDSNTDHPDQGQITLTTDWPERTAGVEIPANYTVTVGYYSTTVTHTTNTLEQLFEPDDYHLRVYNTPEHISVDGATATVEEATGNVDGVGKFVQAMPGWLFTSTLDATIEADTDYELTATMHQQVRQLTLLITPTGDAMDRIEHIEGYLSGAASTLDMDNGTHGTPLNTALTFTKVSDGDNVGKWTATMRLLGVAGGQQKLNTRISFTDGAPQSIGLDSDLSADLATFNADKTIPLTLEGKLVETQTGAEATATITGWTVQEEKDIELH